MATRTAQVIIQVDDKSLVELNTEIKTLETSIKNLKIGTTEWITQNEKLGVLKTRFREATDEAKKLQGVVQKVTGADMVRSVAKLGAGMVGAFSAASGSLKLLGINSKTFDEMTAKATTLMSVMGGLNQISELFSTTNLKGLKSIAAGFGGLVTTVKSASTAMKAALISTGIGALVVGLGLVIANWDKIKNAITGTSKKEQEAFDSSQKSREEIIKSLEDENKVLEERQRLFEESQKYLDTEAVKRASNSAAVEEDIFKQNRLLQEQIDKNTEIINQNKKKLEKSNVDELSRNVFDLETKLNDLQNNISEASVMESGRIEKQLNKAKEKLKVEQEANDLLIQQNVTLAIQNQNYDTQLALNKSILDANAIAAEETKGVVRDIKDLQASYEAQLVVLNTQKDKENEIYQIQKNVLELQRDELNLIPNLTTEQQYQLNLIESKLIALKNENIEFNKQHKLLKDRTTLELENLLYERDLNESIADAGFLYEEILQKNKEYSNELENQVTLLEDQVKNSNELLDTAEKLEQFDISQSKYQEKLKIGFRFNTEEFKKYLVGRSTELELFTQIQEKTAEKLKNDIKIQENNKTNLAILIEQKQVTLDSLSDQFLHNDELLKQAEYERSIAKTSEEKLAAESKINGVLAERNALIQNMQETEGQIADNKDAIVKADIKIQQSEIAILKTTEKTAKKTAEITEEVEEQQKLYKRLQNFVGKYGEQIDAASRALLQSMELISTLFESNATRHQEEIDRLNAQYDEMNSAEADRQDRLLAYEEELKDANGDRYDQLLSLIDQEKAAKNANFVSEKDQQNKLAEIEHKKLVDERKAAQWRKAQAIIDATIQGALAVIKALPNVFLSVAVGILAAAGVATVAAQKIPDVPPLVQYKKGGFTGYGDDDEVAGVVHKKEYVVPAKVVGSPSAERHIAALEQMRNRGYQSGGFVAPANSSSVTGFDYDKLTAALVDAISSLPPSQVSLVAINNGLAEVNLTKNNASLTR